MDFGQRGSWYRANTFYSLFYKRGSRPFYRFALSYFFAPTLYQVHPPLNYVWLLIRSTILLSLVHFHFLLSPHLRQSVLNKVV